jgi:Ca2+-binding EF-hand superfamily protein
MRNYLVAMTVALLSAAAASAQFGANAPNLPNSGSPAEQKLGQPDPADAAPADAMPPNAMFDAIDSDGDGIITKAELRKAIRALKTLDADNDGNITLAEAGASAGPAASGGPDVERMLTEHDKNGDRKLTADEVPPHIMPILQGADKNQDRAIDEDELKAAIQTSQFRNGPGAPGLGPNGRGADPRTGQFLRHDVNNDGRLTLQEIPRQMRGVFRPDDDRNGDGAIDAAELQFVIARMGGAAPAAAAGAELPADANTFRDPNRRNRPRPGDAN